MLYKKLQMLTQIVGCVTIGLLAVYGLLMILSADSPVWAAIGRAATLASGEIPSTFNYQGFLREPDGSLASGSYTITARIYSTGTLGSALYETTVPNVNVRDGLFNIVLGSDPPMTSEAFADVPRYIGISLNNDPELIPRQRVHAVPWALTAKTLVSNARVDGITSTGDIRVQSGELHVQGDALVGGQLVASYLDSTGGAGVGGPLEVQGSTTITGQLDVWGSENVVGPLWASYLGSTSDIMLSSLRQIGDGDTGHIIRTDTYTTSLKRYVVESTTGIITPNNSIAVSHAIVTDFCADPDGCTFYLGMRDGNDEGRLKTTGPYRFSITNKKWSAYKWDGSGATGTDNDGIEQMIASFVSGSEECHLNDNQHINNSSQEDDEDGFWLLSYNNQETTDCILIMED